MNFLELARKRKSTRSFKPGDIPAEKIKKLLDAARNAPSGGNCQPWHFFAIRDTEVKNKICNLACKQPFILDAPVHIVVCADLDRTGNRYGERGKTLYCIQDSAAAIQNMLLCAEEENLGACWCGAFYENILAEILSLKENLRPVAIVPIGFPLTAEARRTQRRTVKEISTFIGFDDESLKTILE